MAFPRMSTTGLWASLILSVYWTTSAAESHDPSPANLSALRRLKRELDATTKEQIQSGFQAGMDFMNVVTEVAKTIKKNKDEVSSVLKGLANFASLAPGIGSLVCSVINVVLAIIPQENTIEELRNGFSEVNRRLDSLAIQISDLATDVEWFNFASVYSQDETHILNAWKKLDELQLNLKLVTSEEDKLRLAEIFTNFYENSATEGSVASIYHYLTVSGTSLSKNINSLLMEKFKCSISEMGRYNVYLSSLLWKGMVLNQLYWKLIGFSGSHKQDEHNRMFKNVFKAQNNTLYFCLDNYQQYLDKDVKEVSTRFTKDQKQEIAVNVQKTLDQKYFWYNWIVMVYEETYESYYKLVHMRRVPVGDVVVAVGYTRKETPHFQAYIKSSADRCFDNIQCSNLKQKYQDCRFKVNLWNDHAEGTDLNVNFSEHAKVLYYVNHYTPTVSTKPFFNEVECKVGRYGYKVNVYLSRQVSVCSSPDACWNGGVCKQLMDSNEHLCDCPDGYYGNRCEKNTSSFQNVDLSFLMPDVTRLKRIEDKLDQVLRTGPAH